MTNLPTPRSIRISDEIRQKLSDDKFAKWVLAVTASYKMSVSDQEYENKCASNPDATRKIAYYMKETGYELEDIDDTERTSEATVIQLLYDFLNFTDGV
jgi:hypothetical protein